MMGNDDSNTINGLKIRPAPGTCSSYYIIYIFICNLCSGKKKCYVGRTVRPFHERVTEQIYVYTKIENLKAIWY